MPHYVAIHVEIFLKANATAFDVAVSHLVFIQIVELGFLQRLQFVATFVTRHVEMSSYRLLHVGHIQCHRVYFT